MRVAPRTEVRVIPDLLHGRDEHLNATPSSLLCAASAHKSAPPASPDGMAG